ncbi:SH3 domain protein, partial [Teladorsagia circumcincta]
GDIMVGNVKSLVDRLSKDFSASRPPLSVHEPKKPVSSKPSQPLQHVITAFAYTAVQDDELTLELGDVIEVLEEVEDGWSRGRQLRTNLIGMFPTNFVKPDVPPSSTLIREDDKDLVVGQPGQVSSKLTKSVIVTSGSEGVATSRPMSSVEPDEAADEVISPLSHVTKTRARPPGKRPASMLLIKKKGTVSPAPITPPAKVVPIRPPPAEIKLEDKKEHSSIIKPSVPPVTHYPTTFSTSSSVDSEWVSRKEYNELLARLASMEARIAQLEKR